MHAVGARRLLSTPSLPCAPEFAYAYVVQWDGLGSALARTRSAPRAFAEFDGFHLQGFPWRAQIVQVPCVYQFHHSGVVAISRGVPDGPRYASQQRSLSAVGVKNTAAVDWNLDDIGKPDTHL